MLTTTDILGPQGRIAARLPHYEQRPEQLRMAEAVATAIQAGHHLTVEAGTGVGKSFAYLVPAILAATEGEEEEQGRTRRIVVSTHTISLQEQLLRKDLPLLNSVIPREFSSVLVKGRGNYVSLRRLTNAAQRAPLLFHDEQDLRQIRELVAWSKSTTDGSLSDIPFRPRSSVWDEAASDTHNCLGRKCSTHHECFYYRARRRVHHAQILVVNHALFFSDLALRQNGVTILPPYDVAILDEAHTLESVAADHMGLSVTSGQVAYILQKLYNDQTQKGLLVQFRSLKAQEQTDRCRVLADELFAEIYDRVRHGGGTLRIREPGYVENPLSPELLRLAHLVRERAEGVENENERQDLQSAQLRLTNLAHEIQAWIDQIHPDSAYWLETSETRRGYPRVKLAAAPIDVGNQIREQLFQQIKTVILTSATLAVGRDDSFQFFRQRLGLTQSATLKLGSPFNYREQARLILIDGMPDPSLERVAYERCCVEMVRRYVERTDGRAFVLFTSYEMLRNVARQLTSWLASRNLALLSQANETSRTQMVADFRANPRSVLFGTDSFWQGVDVPGDALQNVIITKLPFSVPDQPLLQAKLEAIREAGGNPFSDYQLPEAIIKFRQGFGRLIRTQHDRGIVVVLDPRIRSKSYGRKFLDSLPDCEVRVETYASPSRDTIPNSPPPRENG